MRPMLEAIERVTGRDPALAVVWLHGLGADADDFLELPELTGGEVAARWVLPRAPVRPVTINGGLPTRAWFDIRGLGPEAPEDEAGLREAEAGLRRLIERERARGARAVLLGGFSQGGALALHTALRLDRPAAGVAALSTWLPLAARAAEEATAAGRRTPVWMAHGSADEVVRLEWAERSRDRLAALGCPVTWRVYPVGHTVPAEAFRALGAWIAALPAVAGS